MLTDYSKLTRDDFAQTVSDYLSYLVRNFLVDLDKKKPINSSDKELGVYCWGDFRMDDIFNISKGKRLTKENMVSGELNYIGAVSVNNGVRQRIDAPPTHNGNCITVNYNGSVGESFYQKHDFWASDDVNVLNLKDRDMNPEIGLFLCAVIKANKFRFGYGRKWNLEKMEETIIRLPITSDGKPDWLFMEDYIQQLPYSDRI